VVIPKASRNGPGSGTDGGDTFPWVMVGAGGDAGGTSCWGATGVLVILVKIGASRG